MKGMKKKFTLVELLVVIGIIFILLGMLLPAISMAKKKSKGTLCKSNMKQIMTGFTLYSDEHSGYMVAGRTRVSTAYDVGNGMKWRPRWYAQIGFSAKFYAFNVPDPLAAGDNTQRIDNKIFVCPQEDPTTTLFRDNGRNASYGYNFQFLGNARGKLSAPTTSYINWPRNINTVSAFGTTAAIADCLGTAGGKASAARGAYDAILQGGTANGDSKIGNHAWALDPPRLIVGSSDFCNDSSRNAASRSAPYAVHSSKIANIAFADGHVEGITLEEAGYEVNGDGSIGINGDNKMFSGSGTDETPPDIN
jgi:prepilin-type processing-associated H-X9-DG protein